MIKRQESTRPSIVSDKEYHNRLCNLLFLPFNQQDAYRLGLIDADGTLIKDPSNAAEEAALTPFHALAFSIKKFISKQPNGANLLRNGSFALNTLHHNQFRSIDRKQVNSILEQFERNCNFISENNLRFPLEESIIEAYVMKEDGEGGDAGVPSNNAGSLEQLDYPVGQPVSRTKKASLKTYEDTYPK